MFPILEEMKKITETTDCRRIPACREIYSDAFTPIEVMRTLKAASRHCYLLESAENDQKWGRYSFLGYSPTMELTCMDGQMTIRRGAEEEEQTTETFTTEHPGDTIRKILAEYKSPKSKACLLSRAAWWDISPMIISNTQSRRSVFPRKEVPISGM